MTKWLSNKYFIAQRNVLNRKWVGLRELPLCDSFEVAWFAFIDRRYIIHDLYTTCSFIDGPMNALYKGSVLKFKVKLPVWLVVNYTTKILIGSIINLIMVFSFGKASNDNIFERTNQNLDDVILNQLNEEFGNN